MHKPAKSPYLVPHDGSFRITKAPTAPKKIPAERESKKKLKKFLDEFEDLQRKLYADDRYSVLLVFQAMDAAGKDSTIRAITDGLNPAGFQVYSFKAPSREELDHDFLWRTSSRLPERGRIGVFNRSYYEEVLVVRVHPKFLDGQRLPRRPGAATLWKERYQSIREHEKHLARNGTVIVKFWLNVSRKEQRRRFLSRIDVPRKNWKFAAGDVEERQHWATYMDAYEDGLNATSRAYAPWYAIPADDKPFMRATVAEIVVKTLRALPIDYPKLDSSMRSRMGELREILEKDRDA